MSTLHLATRSTLRVARIEVMHVRIPLKKTIRHASHTRDSSDNLVVACQLSDGTTGFGEGVPRDYVTGETIETSLELLRRTSWSDQLSPVQGFNQAVEQIRRFTLPRIEDDERECVGNAARCAAELAMLDAFGRSFGVSLSTLVARLPRFAAISEPRPSCYYSAAITSKSRFREIVSALKLRPMRFKHCKIKVGMDGQDDVGRLAWFRRILGSRIDLRIDANEAWRPRDVVDRIRVLEPFGISAVEQPVRHEEVSTLADVRREVTTPIMLDESLCSRRDAERAIEERTCDLFNIRLSKCGGLLPSLELALLAHDAGLGYQLGCQVGETGILSAAGRHFACSVRGTRFLEGSYERFLVRERLTHENLTFGWRGWAPALKGPGLGVTVSAERLARVCVGRETVHGE